MKLPDGVKEALQDPTCGDVPLLRPHARLPFSWRELQVGNHFSSGFGKRCSVFFGTQCFCEKSSSVDNLILILFCGILFPPAFGSLFFLQCVLKCHDSAT